MKRRLLLGFTAALIFAAPSARAEGDAEEIGGVLEEEVVTTASRSAEQAANAPAFSRTVSGEDLKRFGILSLDEALDFLGVGIRSSRGWVYPEVGARGVARSADNGSHVLLMVNGHVMNEPLYGGAQFGHGLGVPFELIDHIEVVLGPGSVMYGSNAVFAVVNVITKSATTHAGTHVAADLQSYVDKKVWPAAGQRVSGSGAYQFELFDKPAELIAGISYYRHEGIPIELGPQNLGIDPTTRRPNIWGGRYEGTYFQEVPGAHVRFVRDRLEVQLMATQFHYRNTSRFNTEIDSLPNVYEQRGLASVKQSFPLGHIGEFSARLYGDAFRLQSDLYVNGATNPTCALNPPGTRCDLQVTGTALRTGLDLQSNFDWVANHRLTTLLTALGTINDVGLRTETYDQATERLILPPPSDFVPRQTRFVFAASAEQVARPFDWLSLSAGVRVDKDERFPLQPSPRFAVTTHPWEGATLKGVYAEAFRAPSFYETEGSSVLIVRSNNLVPERTDSKELIFEQRVNRHRVAVGVFHSHFKELVDRVLLTPQEVAGLVAAGLINRPPSPTSRLEQFRNASSVDSYGFTTSADTALMDAKLRFGASFTGAYAREPTGELITTAPRAFGNFRVSYELPEGWPTIGVATTFASKMVVDHGYDGNFRPLPFSPPQLELRGALTGPITPVKGLSYRLVGNYAFHTTSPYAIGQGVRSLPTFPQPELAPVKRFETTVGLQYDF